MIRVDIQKELLSPSGKMQLALDFELSKGEFLTIYGKSGAGKTSTLRILAGLLKPDAGSITIAGNSWFDSKTKVNKKTQDRKVGFLFQDYALFPNMTVEENLKYALNKNDNESRVNELIEIVELGDLRNLKPEMLSGGQKQRVALSRALVQSPQLLMLDEPLSALDVEMREKLQDYILLLHKEFKLTTILVSHDLNEIMKMSDQVLVIEHGKKLSQSSPIDVFGDVSQNDTVRFQGMIVQINTQGHGTKADILIGKSIISVSLNSDQAKQLKKGDLVMISTSPDFELEKV